MVPEVRGEPCVFQLLGSLPWPARLLQMKGAFFFCAGCNKTFFFFSFWEKRGRHMYVPVKVKEPGWEKPTFVCLWCQAPGQESWPWGCCSHAGSRGISHFWIFSFFIEVETSSMRQAETLSPWRLSRGMKNSALWLF